jgi:signal transduction histidine kinase
MPDSRRPNPPGAASDALLSGATPLDSALMRANDLGLDLEPIERALLDYVTHPEGLACAEAYLLVWNGAAEAFRGWGWSGAGTRLTLEETLDVARPARPDPDRQEHVACLRRRTFDLESLDSVLRDAWASARAVTGRADRELNLWPASEWVWAVPLRGGSGPFGLLVVAGAPEHPDEARLALFERAATLVSAALSVQQRTHSERRRAQRAVALAEMVRASVSAMNVAEALHLATRLATRVTGARGSAAWRVHGDALRLEVTHGAAGQRERAARELMPRAHEAAFSMAPRMIEPGRADIDDVVGAIESAGLVPLVAYGRPLGALAAWERTTFHPAEPRGFEAADMEFLHTLGDMLAMVLDQAARFDALRAAEREREELRARVRREERLAAAGELASRAAREVRNPIASVAAFARRAHREMREDDPLREYLEIVLQEIDRIDRITGEQLALSEARPPRLAVENLNAIVARVLQRSGEPLIRRRIRLLKRLATDLPPLLLDPERIERVVENIVAQALDAAPPGGRVRIETREAGGFVVLEAAHDGTQDHGALMEQLFTPFAPSRDSGGVGLGVARQIIREHGGEIRVRADAEWSSMLTLTLPVLDNDDRRRPGGDRREPRRDRRQTPDPA